MVSNAQQINRAKGKFGPEQRLTSARPTQQFTYFCLFLFTFLLYFRPNELFPSLAAFNSMAFWCGLLAISSYLFTQLSSGRGLTILAPEIKCVLIIFASALLLMPLSRNIARSWEVFVDPFFRVMIIFIVMVNILVTEARIRGLMWLGTTAGAYLSYLAYDSFQNGIFETEETRVSIDIGGMFGNPNDLCVHLLIFIPIAIALAKVSRNLAVKVACWVSAALMTFGILLTQSRGGFLGLIAITSLAIWKFARGFRLSAFVLVVFVLGSLMALAPSSFGDRMWTLMGPTDDVSSSSGQRRENLERSIVASLRNPLGVGLGNSRMFGVKNLETHNAYTQVSSELGLPAFVAYLFLLIFPLRSLSRIEFEMNENVQKSSLLYLSIATHIGIVGYMVSSFFASVAYNWYVYFPVAFAIGLRRLYAPVDR